MWTLLFNWKLYDDDWIMERKLKLREYLIKKSDIWIATLNIPIMAVSLDLWEIGGLVWLIEEVGVVLGCEVVVETGGEGAVEHTRVLDVEVVVRVHGVRQPFALERVVLELVDVLHVQETLQGLHWFLFLTPTHTRRLNLQEVLFYRWFFELVLVVRLHWVRFSFPLERELLLAVYVFYVKSLVISLYCLLHLRELIIFFSQFASFYCILNF